MSGISKRFLAFVLLVTFAESTFSNTQNFIEVKDNDKYENKELKTSSEYRLPKSVIPIAYNLKISKVDFSSFTYEGTVEINAQVIEETKEIVLHKGNLTVYVKSVNNTQENKRLTISNTAYNETTETFRIILQDNLKASEYVSIQLNFNGTLRNDMIGFYKSSYINERGEEKWLAATQFESTHARHAFPCFDEPAMKSIFNISIFLPKDYGCLGNTVSTIQGNWCIFRESLRMPTYSVAFIVSDFATLQRSDSYLKVWSRPNALKQTQYSFDIGVAALAYFERLFDEPYQLSKMDMVAVPDFSSGAMENWGLITYRETALLYDEVDTPDTSQQAIGSVIVHECSHMWFGNLVTPEWWSYLWLSEGFARYYEYMATNKIEPSWKMDQQFVVDHFQDALNVDGLENSVSMTRDAITQKDIAKMGGTITYSKGASIIRMMENTFGSDVFNAALRNYIKNRKYKSAVPDDLWEALQKVVDATQNSTLNVSVATVMKTWTEQPGFPYISVTIKPDYITFSQERFLLRNSNTIPTDSTWWVPITWTSSGQVNSTSNFTKPVYWLSQRNAEVPNENKDDDWIIINVQSTGFYRVQYDKDSWNKIIKVLMSDNFERIHELNRAAIVDDLLNLARAGLLDYETALRGIQYLKRETNYLPFKSAFTALNYLIRKFRSSTDYDIFKEYVKSLYANIYEKLGYDDNPGDDTFTILLRQTINNIACKLEDTACISKSKKYFSDWRNKQKAIPKNRRSIAYCTAIKYGTPSDWEFLWEQYKYSNVAVEQVAILRALACSEDVTIIKRYIVMSMKLYHESHVRKQDIAYIFSTVYSKNEEGAEFLLDFINNHSDIIFKYYGNYNEIEKYIKEALQWYPTKNIINKVENLIKRNESHIHSMIPTLEKSLKVANFELDWFHKQSPVIINWIVSNENTTAYRLPDNVIPIAYSIHLTPFIIPKNFTFNGDVTIDTTVTKNTKKIVLHADQITIHNVTVMQYTEKNDFKTELLVKNWTETEKYHFLNIIMESPIKAGTNISIKILYTGTLNTEMRGFYRSSYKINNETRWLAATHLEPVGARKLFPCFDEPTLKATFDISVDVPENYTAISNMNVKSQSPGGLWEFYRTPVMSTYLVAVVVSDFESRSVIINNRTYSVWANPTMVQHLSYVLDLMSPLIDFYESHLRISYALPKLDMIALPDFASGAMENWGLLVYRETNMLYDNGKISSIIVKQAIRNVIAHEIAHQWFGNLVSPLRWDYLWLSEGFARYFQYFAYTEVETPWNLEMQFVVDHLQTSFSTDASTSTHPVTHRVYSPTEIRALFDKISYAKAASLIRMIEKLIKTNAFYNALYNYLQECQYSTGTPEALFASLQDEIQSDKSIKFNVTKVMNSWTRQSGFPVVNVVFKNNIATFTQMKFNLRPQKNETSKSTWIVPINWATRSNPNFNNTNKVIWLEKKLKTVEIKNLSDDWIIFNIQQTGYYRVNYDKTMWRRIIAALNSKERVLIHEINRASFIDDMLNLGRAGLLDYDVIFEGILYLQNETAYGPWKAAAHGFYYLTQRFLGHPEIYDIYRAFALKLLKPNFKRLGFNEVIGEEHSDILLRKLILEWLCSLDYSECVNESIRLFKNEQSNASFSVQSNQRNFVYCTAIRHGTVEDWNYMFEKFEQSNYAIEKLSILSALTCSKNSTNLERLLYDSITTDTEIKLQDAKRVFTNVVDNSVIGVRTTLNFILSNYATIQKYFNDDGTVKSILSTISKKLPTSEMVEQFENFASNFTKNVPNMEKSLQSSLKRAKYELNWYNEQVPKIFMNLHKNDTKLQYRLPPHVKPLAYDIYLKPYFEERNFTFEGNVSIDMQIEMNTCIIVVHAHNINITKVYFSDKSYEILLEKYNIQTNMFYFYIGKLMLAGRKLRLNFEYTGILRNDMKGFYRSSYTDMEGNIKWLASTQFEPTFARTAFPCFDEPSFKANFTIHIAKPKGYRTLSNMGSSPKERIDADNQLWDDYETSIFMSSYVLAFIVFEFNKFPETPSKLSVWARPQLINYMNYSFIAGQEALSILENLTKISYPLNEINFVAVPDFDMGAMENWGLVTYREYGLTYDTFAISASFKRYVNTVISHELAHMWFGNLVTLEWWDYTWLNEGFAEYFSHIVSDSLEPRWSLLKQFVLVNLQVAFGVDSSESSHPMNNKVVTPTEAEDAFDKIAYAKSSSVLRMFDHSFGHEIFFEAVQNYLNKHKYANARPECLNAAIQARVDKEEKKLPGDPEVNVTTVISSWTTQPGYPVVNATRSGTTVYLSQERFLLPPTNASEKNRTYWIPITYTTENELDFKNTAPRFWFGKQSKQIELQTNDTWFILNIQEIGFYRVNYDLESWKRLAQVLKSDQFTVIDEVNRAQIVDDSLNLARAGYLDYDTALDLTKYIARESNYLPWKAYFNAMLYLGQRVEGRPDIKHFYDKHMLTILVDIYHKLGFEENMETDDLLDQLNRELVLATACNYNYADCLKQSRAYFDSSRITPNIANAVYCTSIKHGTSNDWNILWNKYLNATLITDRLAILKGLGCSKNSTLLQRFLDLAIEDKSNIRRQDISLAFSAVYSSSQTGLETAINYFTNNLKKLYSYFGNWNEVGSIFKSLAAYITTDEQITNLEKLAKNHDVLDIRSSLNSAIQTAKKNKKWMDKYSSQIYAWLVKNYGTEKEISK